MDPWLALLIAAETATLAGLALTLRVVRQAAGWAVKTAVDTAERARDRGLVGGLLNDQRRVRLLATHDTVVRDRVGRHRGHIVKSQGDGFMVVFSDPAAAVDAALDIQRRVDGPKLRLRRTPVRGRSGIHVGTAVTRDGDYFGRNVAKAARVAAAAAGGQVEHRLKGLAGTHVLWAVHPDPGPVASGPLRRFRPHPADRSGNIGDRGFGSRGSDGPSTHRGVTIVLTHAVHSPSKTTAARSPRSLVLTVVGVLVWGLVASTTAGIDRARPADAEVTALQLTAGKKKATQFKVSSFNILGFGHTTGKRSPYADGRTRMRYAYEILKHHQVNVVGFQELQPEQLATFNKLTGKRWALYPAGRFERIAMHNSIAWNTSRWRRLDAGYIQIPYFRGELVKMPVVKLRHRATGRAVYFANFHNPADSRGNAQKWRDQARRKQIALANRIAKQKIPLIITGDMNEREKYFCAMVGKAPMRAANGGSNRPGKPCDYPDKMGIDWIFGSRSISFTGYKKLETRMVRRTTNHPFIVAKATIPAR